jgi:alpha-galactosidase
MLGFNKTLILGFSVFLFSFTISGCSKKTAEKDPARQSEKATGWDQLALTPPMGWNSWNSFGVKVSEEVLRKVADVMVASGLKEAGYSYIVIDDFWHGGRDTLTGMLYPDPAKFPSGMKALADYIHDRGLKFGIYSDAGTKTCGEMPGSYGYEEKDAQLFAEWGVDYLKYDYCFCPDFVSANNDYRMAIDRYKAMGDALKATGRPIVYSICEWGPRSPWLWGKEVGGHLWRTSYDVYDMWDSPRNEMSPIGIMASVDAVTNLGRFAGPGGWNDPDMLVVGLNNTGNIKGGGCNDIEYRSQMSMWCMLSAPLMIGCDIRNMNESTKTILLNKDIIAIDQDELGKQGFRVFRKDGLEAWKKPLSGDRVAIAFLNRNSWDGSVTASWKELELDPDLRYEVYDVWEHESVEHAAGMLSAKLKPHECQVFLLSLNENE